MHNGFYQGNDDSRLYKLDLSIVYAACAGAWGMVVGWIIYSMVHVNAYRFDDAKWW